MSETILISRYASRRLYNTRDSEYVTLDDIAALIRDGHDIEVRDKKTGEDLTRQTLLQIIAEQETRGEFTLPVNLLTDLVRNASSGATSFIPEFLETSLDMIKAQQTVMAEQISEAARGTIDPAAMLDSAAEFQKRQAELLATFATAWLPGTHRRPWTDASNPPEPGPETQGQEPTDPATSAKATDGNSGASESDDVATLRAELDALRARLDGLG
ncbi:MAG: polyhydroxyalkanoate synthesis repressor PhaR [Paracoccaceae bacterium]|nr:polyhydroxyalkanoate synthesis repressor PhaR [Paracoccaceae bacterium]